MKLQKGINWNFRRATTAFKKSSPSRAEKRKLERLTKKKKNGK